MAQSVQEKLKIKAGMKLLILDAPASFKTGLGKLSEGTIISTTIKAPDQVHWYVKNQAEIEKKASQVLKLLRNGVTVWVYYPKGSSGIQTDLTRDQGWDTLLNKKNNLTRLNLISFDDTWSAFSFRSKTDADNKREIKPAVREIFNWIDPVKKTVRLPDELTAALKKNKQAGAFFEQLSYSHKKEYVEWIVTAKQTETRERRVQGTIERLGKQWKNPRDL